MQIELTVVFFLYGLVFFSMGLAMLLESGRSPLLAEARVLRFLALFGLFHGTHEWLEMAIQMGEWFNLPAGRLINGLRLGLLICSFTCLIIFGLQSLRPLERLSRRDLMIGLSLLVIYVGVFLLAGLSGLTHAQDLLYTADALARYILAVPGAVLAAVALYRQSIQARTAQRLKLGKALQLAAWSFAIYSLTQVFVPALDFFPAKYLNTSAFIGLFGIPIQVVRAVLAGTITISLLRAIQAVEDQRQQEFLTVQQARLDALEQIRQDLVERESLRRELLRHTVIAQEDERARIARELHDETAQILTAFSLNLAALRETVPNTPKVASLLGRLQELSRQMADGVYALVHDLRPAQLDDLGLVAALHHLAEEERKRSGLRIAVEVLGPRQRLDTLVETVFFRVAQEAVTNIVRHAQVQRGLVQLVFSANEVLLRVCDEGIGFDLQRIHAPPRGWGLAGMRERAESVNGQFRLRSSAGQGTMVEVAIPVSVAGTIPAGG